MYKNIFSSSHQHPNQQKSTKKFSKFKMAQSIYLSMLKKFNHIPVLLIHHRNPFSKVSNLILFQFCNFSSAIKLGKSVSPTTIDTSRLIKPVNRISPSSDVGSSISGSTISSQISATTSIKAISPSSLPKLKEPRPNTEVIQGQPLAQSSTSEVTENGTRRFRCDICDIGFRFQVCSILYAK